jgi:hypothetical protein
MIGLSSTPALRSTSFRSLRKDLASYVLQGGTQSGQCSSNYLHTSSSAVSASSQLSIVTGCISQHWLLQC